MKAAIRFLRHNADVIPGNLENIITNGPQQNAVLARMAAAEDLQVFRIGWERLFNQIYGCRLYESKNVSYPGDLY